MSSTTIKPKPPKSSKDAKSSKGSKSSSTSKTPTSDDPKQTHKLSLKGSAKMVSEFFDYGINTILFQRGVYPAEDFTYVKKYGLNMLISSDDQVKSYIRRITTQLTRWMLAGKIKKLVVVVTSKDTGEDVERWQFDVSHTKPPTASTSQGAQEKEKGEAEVQAEIQSLFRQITACVTFLPMLDGRCTFNVLVYADGDAEVPMEWGDSEAREINGGEKVVLRSWGTSSHRVETAVSYRVVE
ncbi:DNA-binding protein [Terfezia boudieri ATCC MYA-4762]|uniref:DNA-binding protein n=1 Tax=Terfezia boudieri ATCC MYA-4762 TaxID=1051890 RepID=A0A3N4LT47_9PEZI|nr:DNA-binding protein [Terfezia boudieri ATCC MYA-4762]